MNKGIDGLATQPEAVTLRGCHESRLIGLWVGYFLIVALLLWQAISARPY